MRTVGYDLDGTLFSMEKTIEMFNKEYNKTLTLEDIKEYDFSPIYQLNDGDYLATWFKHAEEIILTSDLNKKVFDNLMREHECGSEIIIVTARDSRFDTLNHEILTKLGIPYSKLYTNQSDKLDVLIQNNASRFFDDKGDLIENLMNTPLEKSCELTIINAPYNQEFKSHSRFIL